MASFKDVNGKSWELRITPTSMRRVETLTGVKLGTILQDEFRPLQEMFTDPVKTVDVLYALCQPEADRCKISDEQFGESMVGDALENAVDAFMEALADFFPSRQSQMLKRLFQKVKQYQTTLAEKAEAEFEELMSIDFASKLQQ